MKKKIKIIVIALVGIFFSIATLEIDIFDYDNSFFDNYDSYVKVDNKVAQRVLQVEFNKLPAPEIILPLFCSSNCIQSPTLNEERLFLHPYKRKLFLVKSSLLI